MRQMYSARLLDHFQNPRNSGELEQPTAAAELSNPACGDVLRLSFQITDERIAAARFRAKGCVPAIACGSALTELLTGKTLAEARALTRKDIVDAVDGLPAASDHAAALAIDTLRAALDKR
jgi:nitrogen fixation protein NifU and related proteins